MGKLIAIEGIDGSGKGTQAKLLKENLESNGNSVALFGFPRYTVTEAGEKIGRLLNGELGHMDSNSPYLTSLLFAEDRKESRQELLEALNSNDYVICDRYVASNMAHQGARHMVLKPRDAIEVPGGLWFWISSIEYAHNEMPVPDLTILLVTQVDIAEKMIRQKEKRPYTDNVLDMHEKDKDHLRLTQHCYLLLHNKAVYDEQYADKLHLRNWISVGTSYCVSESADGKSQSRMRDIPDIASEIFSMTINFFKPVPVMEQGVEFRASTL